MTRVRSFLSLTAAVALFCCGCQTTAPRYRSLDDREITSHEPTGLLFPSQLGSFQRSFAQEKLDDPKSIRVGYGHMRKGSPHMIIISVGPPNVIPSDTLRSRKQSFLAAHRHASVNKSLKSDSLAVFRDWQTVILDYYGFVADFPPNMRHQLQRLLYAARTYRGYTLFLESTPFYPGGETVFFPDADKLVHELFPPGI